MDSETHTANDTSAVNAAANAPNATEKPDRSAHDTVKARYKMLQLKYTDLAAVCLRSTVSATAPEPLSRLRTKPSSNKSSIPLSRSATSCKRRQSALP